MDKEDDALKMEGGDSESEKEKMKEQETLLMVTTAPATRYVHLLSSLRVNVHVHYLGYLANYKTIMVQT